MGYANCGCGPGFYGRRYMTKAEKREWLSDYAKELENELAGVKERIQQLQESV